MTLYFQKWSIYCLCIFLIYSLLKFGLKKISQIVDIIRFNRSFVLGFSYFVSIASIISSYHRYVPLPLTWFIKSYFFIDVSTVPVKLIALALFTKISIPPNFFTASSTAFLTSSSLLTSTIHGKHLPPAASTVKQIN